MEKVDYKKELKDFYRPSSKQVTVVDLPAMNFLMVDGKGPPLGSDYQQALKALYPVAYTLKFMIKKGAIGVDFSVLPLEGLWWADDMADFIRGIKDRWQWTLMIMQPDMITADAVEEAVAQVKAKKNPQALRKLRFERFDEGKAAQILHVGSYDTEGPTVQKVHRLIEDANGKLSGKHHEIYLNDPRRTAPEKLKTVIRQPFK